MAGTSSKDSTSGYQSSKRYEELVNNYESVNEKLKRELNDLKKSSHSSSSVLENTPRHKEKVEELAAVQDLLEDKNGAFIRNHLEAALWHKATSMFEVEPTTRLCKKGFLKLHRTGLVKLKKNVWVEIHFSEGKACDHEYEPGYVMLEYAGTKREETINQCKVTEVFLGDSSAIETNFSARVVYDGRHKVLVFGCDTEWQRDGWIRCIKTALADVRHISNWQKNNCYTLKLQFRKKKIGLLMKERCPQDSDWETKKDSGKVGKTAKKTSTEMKVENDDRPCELLVKKIIDKNLAASGLREDCILTAIDETVLVGKICSEQLKLLSETPKPFVLTFRGQNFKKTDAMGKSFQKESYFTILKDLVAFQDNDIKSTFNFMVKGTLFEKELKSSTDKSATILALLDNQRMLIDFLQIIATQAEKQQDEQEFKE